MRTMLLPGLLGAVRDNLSRLNEPPSIFELGKVYLWDDEVVAAPAHAAEPGAVLPHEPEARGRSCSPARSRPRAGPRPAARPTSSPSRASSRPLLGALRLEADFAAARRRPPRTSRTCIPASRPRSRCPRPAASAWRACCGRTSRRPTASRTSRSTSRCWRSTASPRSRCRRRRSRTSARTRRRARTSPWWSAATRRADGVVAVARRAGGKLVRSVRVFDVYEGDQVAGRQALAGPARRDALARAHAGREGHRRPCAPRSSPRSSASSRRRCADARRTGAGPAGGAAGSGRPARSSSSSSFAQTPASSPPPAHRPRPDPTPTCTRSPETPTTCAQTFKTGSSLPAACDPASPSSASSAAAATQALCSPSSCCVLYAARRGGAGGQAPPRRRRPGDRPQRRLPARGGYVWRVVRGAHQGDRVSAAPGPSRARSLVAYSCRDWCILCSVLWRFPCSGAARRNRHTRGG